MTVLKLKLCVTVLLYMSFDIGMHVFAVAPRTALYDPEQIIKVRQALTAKAPWALASLNASLKEANHWMRYASPPYLSVMQKSVVPPSGDKHDYMSLDQYYWPCTQKLLPNTTGADHTCSNGILVDGNVCCSKLCLTCQDTCMEGATPCCWSKIRLLNRSCSLYPAPCLVTAPVCNTTTGLPWHRYDGYTNPATKQYDHDRLINMTSAVISLATAYFFSNDTEYGLGAANLLYTWFVNPATRQNPNSGLKYGHFIPGVVNGSHDAIIDIHSWSELLDAVALLDDVVWSSTNHTNLRSWFVEFGYWLHTNNLAQQEQAATNSHGVWFDVQVLAITIFTGNTTGFLESAARARNRIYTTIMPDGTIPAELSTTNTWSNSVFCLDAFFHVATLISSGLQSFNLTQEQRSTVTVSSDGSVWNYTTAQNAGIRVALDWQLQFLGADAKRWPFPQSIPFSPPNCKMDMTTQCINSYASLLRKAGLVYDSKYESLISSLPGIDIYAWSYSLLVPPVNSFSWELVMLTDAAIQKGAVCLDGSPGGYYIRQGTDDNKTWVVFHQGGGWCRSERECLSRTKMYLGSSNMISQFAWRSTYTDVANGLLSSNAFRSATIVYALYCDGGSWSGDLNEPFQARRNAASPPQNIYFRGRRLLDAMIDSLLPRGLNDASILLYGGCSAGALATYINVDYVAHRMRPGLKTVALADAMFDIPAPNFKGEEVFPDQMNWVFETMNVSASIPSKCLLDFPNGTECMFGATLIDYIATPTFVLNSIYDDYQAVAIVGANESCRHNISRCPDDIQLYWSMYAGRMVDKFKNLPLQHGGALTECSAHCTTNANHWDSSQFLDGLSIGEAFVLWYDSVTSGQSNSSHRYFGNCSKSTASKRTTRVSTASTRTALVIAASIACLVITAFFVRRYYIRSKRNHTKDVIVSIANNVYYMELKTYDDIDDLEEPLQPS